MKTIVAAGMGVRRRSGTSSGPATLPVVFKPAVEVVTAEGEDRVGSADCPKHSGPLETGTDHGLATGFDDAGTNKQMLASKFGIAHAVSVPREVVGLDTNLLEYFGIGGIDDAKLANQLFDFALVEQPFLVDLHPGFLFDLAIGV